MGKETTDILSHKHDELECFGCGDDEDVKRWNAVIRQAMIAGYLDKDVENYGIIKVTKQGKDFLKKPVSFKIVEDKDCPQLIVNHAGKELVIPGWRSCVTYGDKRYELPTNAVYMKTNKKFYIPKDILNIIR